MMVVILISPRATCIHMTAVAGSGDAIDLGIDVGLQKIGSNLIGGIMLLVSNPIRHGDEIVFEKKQWRRLEMNYRYDFSTKPEKKIHPGSKEV
ncbi:MAG: mechanosensitive ion channel [Desulfobacterales bacterium]|nr:MAG: mechanosensitive ion channel [Desulfobacterales bacterium]